MATTAIPANNAQRLEKFKEQAKLWGARLARLIQAILVVGIACVLGRYLGKEYGSFVPSAGNDELIRLSFFSAASLSTLKELLNIFPKLWGYMKAGKGENLYDFSSFIFITSLALAVASLGITKDNGPAVTPPPPQSTTYPAVFLQPAGRSIKFLVPFSENAEGCDASAAEFKQGLVWVTGTEHFIDQLTQGLSQCSVTGKPVKLKIVGFASSADFQSSDGKKCAKSDDLNVAIANLRAQRVQAEMNRALGTWAGRIIITPKQWGNSEFQSMRTEALFNDRDEGDHPLKERGDLTRRADISVTDAGDCEPR